MYLNLLDQCVHINSCIHDNFIGLEISNKGSILGTQVSLIIGHKILLHERFGLAIKLQFSENIRACNSTRIGHRLTNLQKVYKIPPIVAPMENMYKMSWDLKEKNKIRRAVCKGAKPYKFVLMMPGDSCLDLKLMVDKGSIGPETKIYLIERDSKAVKKIKETLKSLGRTDAKIFQSELHEIEFNDKAKFDFVYLDTCGQLNEHVLNWISKQVQLGVFEEGARIAVAFSQWFRGGAKLYNNLSKFLKEEKISLAKVINQEDEVTEFQADTHKVMGTVLRNLFGDIEETYLYKNADKAIPMHVFVFRGRQGNKGIGSIIKFLAKYTDYEPALITPGVKAAAKRYKLTKKVKRRYSARRESASTAAGAIKVGRVGRTPLEVKLERTTSELELKTSSIKRLENLVKEMDRRLAAASKSIKSLNGRVLYLENKLKSQQEPVMIKNVISDNGSVK